MRVCLIITSFKPIIGGTERRTERLAGAILGEGVDVVVLTRQRSRLRRFETIAGIPVHRVGHASSTKVGALSFALHALWLLASRFKSYGIVHAQNTDTPLLIGVLAKLILRRKLVVTVNTEPAIALGQCRPTGPLRLILIKHLADAVGALSPRMAEELVEGGLPRSRVHLLPSGVDTTVFRPPAKAEREHARCRLSLLEDSVVWLFIGRLYALKRVDLLIRAWSRLSSDVRRTLLIVGDGPERAALEALASELDLNDVRFEGVADDVSRYLYAADAFVLPSQQEGLSSALLEAMAVGLPVVVSDLSANRALVCHGHNGLTFPVGNLAALTKQLVSLDSDDLRRTLGHKALEVARHYSMQEAIAAHLRLYAGLTTGAVARGSSSARLDRPIGPWVN